MPSRRVAVTTKSTPHTTPARPPLEGGQYPHPLEKRNVERKTLVSFLSTSYLFTNYSRAFTSRRLPRRRHHRVGIRTKREVARKTSYRGVSTRGDDDMWVEAPRASPWYPSVRLAYRPASGAGAQLCGSCHVALSTGSAARRPGQRTLPSRPAQESRRTLPPGPVPLFRDGMPVAVVFVG